MNIDFKGVIPPIVTPLTSDGKKVSEENLRKVIRHVIGNGCSGIFTGGSQGEFFTQNYSERLQAIEISVDEAAGKFPVLAGTASIATCEAIELSKEAEKLGADAISVINPYFISLNDDELFHHYEAIAKAVHIPMFLYNNPGRTHNNIPVSVVRRLAKIDNIIGMKDSGGDLTYVNSLLTSIEGFKVFCGKDTCIYAELSMGASGAVAATANVAPRLVSNIYKAFSEGNLVQAREYQKQLIPLRDAFGLGSFPVVVKEALQLIGIDAGPARLPVEPMTEANRDKLRDVLIGLKLL